MLGEADRGVWGERKAGDAEAVDVVLAKTGGADDARERAA